MKKSTLPGKLLLFVMVLFTAPAFAQITTSWTGAFSTAWNNSNNWTNGIPDATKEVVIGDSYFTGAYQPVISVSTTCKTLTVGGDNSAYLNLSRSLTVKGFVYIKSNGTIESGASILYLSGDFTNDGSYVSTATSSRVALNGTGIQTVGGAVETVFKVLYVSASCKMKLSNNISIAGTGGTLAVYGEVNPGIAPSYKITNPLTTRVYSGGKLLVYGATFNDNYTLTGGNVAFNDGSNIEYASNTIDQQISASFTYSTLTISGSTVKSLSGNLPVLSSRSSFSGNILVNAGTLDMKYFSANRGTTITGGQFSLASGATLKLSGSANFPKDFLRKSFDVNSTVIYYGTTQSISNETYGKLLITGGGTKTVSTNFTVQGDLTLENGVLNSFTNSVSITLLKDFITTGGTIDGSAATYVFNGAADQYTDISSGFPNVTINKSGGSLILSNDLLVNGTLTFTSGKIQTDDKQVIIESTGTVSGASQTRGWVFGNLKKYFVSGSNISKSFEIGSVDDYAPATVTFASITMEGSVVAYSTLNDHPEIDYSGINPDKSVNRYWTLSASGLTFTTADVTLSWSSADMDAGANYRSFTVADFSGTAWAKPNSSPRLSTTIEANNVTSLSTYAVGETLNTRTWTGANMTTDWMTPKNWLGGLPDATTSTTIPSTLEPRRRYPILISGQQGEVLDLTIESNATLTLTDGAIKIKGNASSDGRFVASNGTVEFNGSTQTLNSGLFYNNLVKNLIVSSNLTLADQCIVIGELSVNTGKTIYTNDNLVLKSDATGTARIAPLPVNGSGVATAFIDGNVSIERYIPARKAWRLLGVPIKSSNAPTICGSWQEGAYGTSFAPNPNPGYGVHITGGTIMNGYDQSLTNLPSVKVYDNATNGFLALPSATGTIRPITDYSGYMVYIRGDRSIDPMQGVNAAVTSTTLRMRGEVKTGKQTISVNANGYTVLGNPYPSRINFETLVRSNTKNSFYIWDPKMGGSNGLGAYVSVSYNSGSGSYDISTSGSSISQYIPSGEAILIESEDGSSAGTIVVNESDKSTEGTDALFGRANKKSSAIRVDLMQPNNDGTLSVIDGAMTTFHIGHSNDVDRDDVKKINGSSENISFLRANKNLVIERRSALRDGDTSFISMTQLKRQTYVLQIVGEEISAGNVQATLIDQYSHQTSVLDLTAGTAQFTFTVNADAASSAANRFVIVYSERNQTNHFETAK